MSDEPILYTYRGPDRFYGIPRRSLTQADFDALTPVQQRDVIASTSYVERPAKTGDTKPDKTGQKEG